MGTRLAQIFTPAPWLDGDTKRFLYTVNFIVWFNVAIMQHVNLGFCLMNLIKRQISYVSTQNSTPNTLSLPFRFQQVFPEHLAPEFFLQKVNKPYR